MTNLPIREGGCQCGAIRYRAEGEPLLAALCHCSMCRRASAAPAVAWAMYPQGQVTFLQDQPKTYASSNEARRGFLFVAARRSASPRRFCPASSISRSAVSIRRKRCRRRCTTGNRSACRGCTLPTTCRASPSFRRLLRCLPRALARSRQRAHTHENHDTDRGGNRELNELAARSVGEQREGKNARQHSDYRPERRDEPCGRDIGTTAQRDQRDASGDVHDHARARRERDRGQERAGHCREPYEHGHSRRSRHAAS